MSSPVEMTEMYDHALLGILQHVGNVQDFLQVYFGFLYRKTDFYRLLSCPNDRMGFPPGIAEKMVQKAFKSFERLSEQGRDRRLKELKQKEEPKAPPPVEQEVLVESVPQQDNAEPNTEAVRVEKSSSEPEPSSACSSQPDTSPQATAGGPPQPSQDAKAEASNTDPASATSQTQYQADPDSYNGATRENYSWSQDYTDVEIRVFVSKTVVKGRQVLVNLLPGSVRVCVRDGAEEQVLMEGELPHKINTENSLWSLEPGRCVVLSLSKVGEVWWNAVLKGEKEIDINQINRERGMASVDEEEHAVLDRLSFDYHQKLQGKPQSHEMKVHDMLKKGWDAEGSPFRGQQFDPTMFDIPPSAVQF
ncbi:nudC domain-containing protein 3 [Gadus macrocephalus]|uniref:nudC domain-containing protein 3 n=1 Tax=Gadus macrocephalus TaxID=80720 RepID=UPI0028CB41E6|nr:nudC domain-containing protein 3 [Gadus macrocephalus]